MKAGALIKLLRTASGQSQTTVAKDLHVSRAYLSQVENDKRIPALPLLERAAKKYKLPVALFMLGGEDDSPVMKRLHDILTDVLAAKLKGLENGKGTT